MYWPTSPKQSGAPLAPRANAECQAGRLLGLNVLAPEALGLSWAPPPLGIASVPSMCLHPCAQVALLVQTPPRPEGGCKAVTVLLTLTPAVGSQAGPSQAVTYHGCP